MDKAQLIAQLQAHHDATRDQVTSLDPARVIHAESGWRVRDIIAHMAVWYGVRVRALRMWQAGETFSVDDVEVYNVQTVADRADRPYAEVLAEWESEFAALLAVLAALPPEQFTRDMTYPWGTVGAVGVFIERLIAHQAEHYDEIRALA